MSPTPRLSDREKGQIEAFRDQNLSFSEIAEKLGRHRTTISSYLRRKFSRKTPKKVGRPTKLSQRTIRNIIRHAVSLQQSPTTVKRVLNLTVSVRTIQRVLQRSPALSYVKRISSTGLTSEHKKRRLNWSKSKLQWSFINWTKVVFTDEKKFNLDGPDGLQFYWHDLRREPEIYSKRVQGGRSVMVWGSISYQGKVDLVGIDGKMDSEYYVNVLQTVLLPVCNKLLAEDWILQQDNAAVHTSQRTNDFLDVYDVDVLPWPAKSPDLNIIENVWGRMARDVYKNGRQFENVVDLQDAIMEAWNDIDLSYIRTLYRSIPSRLISVVQNAGGPTTY